MEGILLKTKKGNKMTAIFFTEAAPQPEWEPPQDTIERVLPSPAAGDKLMLAMGHLPVGAEFTVESVTQFE